MRMSSRSVNQADADYCKADEEDEEYDAAVHRMNIVQQLPTRSSLDTTSSTMHTQQLATLNTNFYSDQLKCKYHIIMFHAFNIVLH